jgi:hypothetical protein
MGAAIVLFVLGGFVVAETYQGLITKHEDGKIMIRVRSKEDKKGTDKTFKVSKDVKIAKAAKKGEEGEEVKVDDFTKMVEKAAKSESKRGKGVFAKIETKGDGDAEEVVKITVGGGRRKGKAKDE